MYGVIKRQLEDYQLDCDDACMEIIDVAVDKALQYVLGFTLEVSSELVASELYSEAMVAGLVARKIKTLLGEEQ